jgi:hypothetical protein
MILITYPNVDIQTIRRERYSHPDIAIRRRMTILYFSYFKNRFCFCFLMWNFWFSRERSSAL